MDRCAAHSPVLHLNLSRMDADPQLGRVSVQAPMRRQPALDRDRAIDRIGGGVEDDEEAIAGVVDLATAMLGEAAAQLGVEPRTEVVPRSVTDRLDERR